MSTATQTLEDAIVALIAGTITSGASIEPLPELVSEYDRVIDDPKVWVALNGSKGLAELSTSELFQQRNFTFEIMLKSRRLRDNLGIYNLYDLCLLALAGKRPIAGFGKMKFIQLQSNGEKDGVFSYSLYMEFPGLPIVENFDTTTGDGPNLQNVFTTQS